MWLARSHYGTVFPCRVITLSLTKIVLDQHLSCLIFTRLQWFKLLRQNRQKLSHENSLFDLIVFLFFSHLHLRCTSSAS